MEWRWVGDYSFQRWWPVVGNSSIRSSPWVPLPMLWMRNGAAGGVLRDASGKSRSEIHLGNDHSWMQGS
jgi:hypothetical protein